MASDCAYFLIVSISFACTATMHGHLIEHVGEIGRIGRAAPGDLLVLAVLLQLLVELGLRRVGRRSEIDGLAWRS